jgi:hypothetical protein
MESLLIIFGFSRAEEKYGQKACTVPREKTEWEMQT